MKEASKEIKEFGCFQIIIHKTHITYSHVRMIRVPIQVGGGAKCVLVGGFECGVHVIKTYPYMINK